MNGYIKMYKFFSEKSSSWQYSSVQSYPKNALGRIFRYGNPDDKPFGLVINKDQEATAPEEIYLNPKNGDWSPAAEFESSYGGVLAEESAGDSASPATS